MSYEPPIYEYRSPKWADAGNSKINCEINHPLYGWLPYTADPSDTIADGRRLYAAIAATPSAIAAYVEPPPPVPTPEELEAEAFKQTALDETRPLQERFDALLRLVVR